MFNPHTQSKKIVGGVMIIHQKPPVVDVYDSIEKNARILITLSEAFWSSDKQNKVCIREEINRKFDALLENMMDNFDNKKSSFDYNDYFSKRSTISLSSDALKRIPPQAVPVVVVRELVGNHRLVFDPKKLSHWADYKSRYQNKIMNTV